MTTTTSEGLTIGTKQLIKVGEYLTWSYEILDTFRDKAFCEIRDKGAIWGYDVSTVVTPQTGDYKGQLTIACSAAQYLRAPGNNEGRPMSKKQAQAIWDKFKHDAEKAEATAAAKKIAQEAADREQAERVTKRRLLKAEFVLELDQAKRELRTTIIESPDAKAALRDHAKLIEKITQLQTIINCL